jgi:hypothetical protein
MASHGYHCAGGMVHGFVAREAPGSRILVLHGRQRDVGGLGLGSSRLWLDHAGSHDGADEHERLAEKPQVKKGVSAPIVGASKVSQLDDGITALELSLSAEEITHLEAHYVRHAVTGFA